MWTNRVTKQLPEQTSLKTTYVYITHKTNERDEVLPSVGLPLSRAHFGPRQPPCDHSHGELGTTNRGSRTQQSQPSSHRNVTIPNIPPQPVSHSRLESITLTKLIKFGRFAERLRLRQHVQRLRFATDLHNLQLLAPYHIPKPQKTYLKVSDFSNTQRGSDSFPRGAVNFELEVNILLASERSPISSAAPFDGCVVLCLAAPKRHGALSIAPGLQGAHAQCDDSTAHASPLRAACGPSRSMSALHHRRLYDRRPHVLELDGRVLQANCTSGLPIDKYLTVDAKCLHLDAS